jgi:hypothetical protein
MGLPVPLELPTPVGAGQLIDATPVHAVVHPAEVYSSGALLRVRIEHQQTPDSVAENPALVLLAYPGQEDTAVQVFAGDGLEGRALRVVAGSSNGPSRWDLEFWWPRERWADAQAPRLSWPVAGLDIVLDVSRGDLEAARS